MFRNACLMGESHDHPITLPVPSKVLSHIVDLRSDDKKPKPKYMDVPIQKSRASGVFPYFVCDNAKYVFGVEKVKRSEFEKKFNLASSEENSVEHTVLEENDKEVTLVHRRSRECFETFKTLHHSILDGLDDQEVRGFLEKTETQIMFAAWKLCF